MGPFLSLDWKKLGVDTGHPSCEAAEFKKQSAGHLGEKLG